MKKCKNCGEEIAKNAKTCPKCGARYGLPGFVKFLILIIIIVGCIIGCMSSCTDSVNDAIEETANEYKDINGKTEFSVGESFENKHLKVSLTQVNKDFKDYSEYATIKKGYKVVQFNFEGKNVGTSKSELFSYADFDCYADNESMNQFYSVNSSDNNGLDFIHELTSGKIGKGSIYCEVPIDAKDITVEYDAAWLTDNSKIIFKAN